MQFGGVVGDGPAPVIPVLEAGVVQAAVVDRAALAEFLVSIVSHGQRGQDIDIRADADAAEWRDVGDDHIENARAVHVVAQVFERHAQGHGQGHLAGSLGAVGVGRAIGERAPDLLARDAVFEPRAQDARDDHHGRARLADLLGRRVIQGGQVGHPWLALAGVQYQHTGHERPRQPSGSVRSRWIHARTRLSLEPHEAAERGEYSGQWADPDLNRGHRHFQCRALPTELSAPRPSDIVRRRQGPVYTRWGPAESKPRDGWPA